MGGVSRLIVQSMGIVAFMLPRTSTGRQGPRNAPPLLAALPPVSETPCHTAWVHNAEKFFFAVQKSVPSCAAEAHCCSALDPACGSRRHHHTHPLCVVLLCIDGRAELSGPLVRCVRGSGTVRSSCAPAGSYRDEEWSKGRCFLTDSRQLLKVSSCANRGYHGKCEKMAMAIVLAGAIRS